MTIDLFEYGAARNTDPLTSKAAAESINATRLEAIVLAAITRSGSRGMTSEEAAAAVSMELGSITPRLSPLEQKGLIRRTDARRAGKSGRGRIVWSHG
jgi:DNA-binding MarR family transcriptional regulator